MKRRQFLLAGSACAGCLLSQALGAQTPWQSPSRFARPDSGSDEGGLWSLMDREEARLRREMATLRLRRRRLLSAVEERRREISEVPGS